jgi:polyisoprenoid-binding protein YceI
MATTTATAAPTTTWNIDPAHSAAEFNDGGFNGGAGWVDGAFVQHASQAGKAAFYVGNHHVLDR